MGVRFESSILLVNEEIDAPDIMKRIIFSERDGSLFISPAYIGLDDDVAVEALPNDAAHVEFEGRIFVPLEWCAAMSPELEAMWAKMREWAKWATQYKRN